MLHIEAAHWHVNIVIVVGLRRSVNWKTEPTEFCLVVTLVFRLSFLVPTLQVSIWSFWLALSNPQMESKHALRLVLAHMEHARTI
jgi:hypothetical protein